MTRSYIHGPSVLEPQTPGFKKSFRIVNFLIFLKPFLLNLHIYVIYVNIHIYS